MTIPNGWKQVPLREVCRVVEGQVDPREPEYRDLPHINGEVIESGSGRLLNLRTATEDGLISGKYLFAPGMVLYSKLRPYLRKVTIAPSRGVCSADMYPLMFDPERVDAHFAMFSLLAEPFTRYAVEESRRARMPKLNRVQLMAWEMPLPQSLEVQQRIAADLAEQLSVAEGARRAAEERVGAAAALQSAYLRAVFEQATARAWKSVKLGDVAKIGGGLQKTPGRKPTAHHCPYLTVRNVQRGTLDLSNVERFEVSPSELERLRLVKGDILIVEGNGSPDQIGRNAVFDLDGADWIHQNHVIRVRLGGDALHQFVSLFLNSPAGKTQMLQRARSTSGLYTLSVDKIRSLQVPLPSIAEQTRLVEGLTSRIRAAEHLAGCCRDETKTLDALPSALLRAVFGGE
jgi:type I restriction enzyme S subunit